MKNIVIDNDIDNIPNIFISKMPYYKSINNNIFIYENVLSIELIKECENFVYMCINKNIYNTTNHISWSSTVVGKSDIIKIIQLENENPNLKEKICYELKNRYNFMTEGLKLNVNIMYQNCYIDDHYDDHVNYAFTIYLNKNWEKSNGGIFQFDIDNIKYNILPKYNTMVLLKNNIHRVTNITSNVIRITLQGFYSESFFYKNNSINYLLYDKTPGIIEF